MIRKAALLGLVIAGHIGLFLWLEISTRYRLPAQDRQSRTAVEFITRHAPKAVAAGFETPPPPSPGRRTRTGTPARAPEAPSPPAAPAVLRLIDAEGRPLIPRQALDGFLANGRSRQFEVQRGGLDDMEALLERPVVLDYRSTRFDAVWQGDKPRLTRVLEKAVEKTTATVKIPVPGRPGAYLQCKLMVLAASGGCGFTANDDGYYLSGDDPDTLSPEEERQCQAWWQLIVSAKTQGVWRRTREVYEQECRKPPAKP